MMRPICLLAASLLSCSVLVGKINPCFNGEAQDNTFCFEQKKSLTFPGEVTEMKSGDINGDDKLDLVVIAPGANGQAIFVLINNGQGFTQEEIIGPNSVVSFDIAASQIPGSRKDDIIVIDSLALSLIREIDGEFDIDSQSFGDLGVAAGLNPAVGSFGQFNSLTTRIEVAVAFLDPASDRGVVHNFPILESANDADSFLGDSEFNSDEFFDSDGNDLSIEGISAVIDFQAHNLGDDLDDEYVILFNSLGADQREIALFQNEPQKDTTFPTTIIFPLDPIDTHITIANFNDDPQVELFFEGPDLANGAPALASAKIDTDVPGVPLALVRGQAIPLNASYQTSTPGDVDGDGRLDLLIANEQDQVEILRQKADGTFGISSSILSLSAGGELRQAMLSFDANKDGVDDIFVSDGIDQVEVFFSAP